MRADSAASRRNERFVLARQDRIELRGGLRLERRQHMRIGVQRQADLRMPERLHDRSWVHALQVAVFDWRIAETYAMGDLSVTPEPLVCPILLAPTGLALISTCGARRQ